MSSVTDKLADALAGLLNDVDGLASEFAICREISESSYGKAAREALAVYREFARVSARDPLAEVRNYISRNPDAFDD